MILEELLTFSQMQYKPQRGTLCLIMFYLLFSAALVVRFLTRRFIWEYDPTLGKTVTTTVFVINSIMTGTTVDQWAVLLSYSFTHSGMFS